MHVARHFILLTIIVMILFSSTIPVYASYIKIKEPSSDEKRLFDKILARLDSHSSLMKVQVSDVEKSFSEPLKISFPCSSFSPEGVDSVSISVKTQFAGFDPEVAKNHVTVLLGGMYVWDCTAVKEMYTLTIECKNTMMLNPSFIIKEETESDEKKIVAMTENEMTLYHEFLHGELMIDAMKDPADNTGWRKDACLLFAGNNNKKIDYGPSDGDHKIISGLELDYLAKVVDQNGGKLILATIKKESVGKSEFTQVVATFDQLGAIAKRGFFVFARAVNMNSAEIVVSEVKETIAIKGSLKDPSSDGAVRLFVLPKTGTPNVKLDLTVDGALKSIGSEFVFTVKLQNQRDTDTSGTISLGIDGLIVAEKDVDVPANSIENMKFVWKSDDDMKASKHIAVIDGFSSASNEVIFYVFERLESRTVRSSAEVTDQMLEDPDTKEKISIAKPNRISATIIVDDNIDIRLTAPDGTPVVGKNALVNTAGSKAHIVTVSGESLVVRYTELNEKLWFFAVKPALTDLPLPSGGWSIRSVDSNGNDANARIKYYVSYTGNSLHLVN